MSQFKNIALDKLEATTQTRQFFDEAALNELAQSIATQGVLQPILVRTKGKKHLIIAGERRFRAAKLAGLKEIPCHVVEMDDNQALEAQITENLQRKDVHPMEEAHAFKRLMDEAGFTIDDVAEKIGKSDRYVAGRLKLLDLIPGFQEALFADKMPLAGAVKIAAVSSQVQNDYWEEDWNDRWEEDDFYKTTSDIERDLDYMTNELDKAKFDITSADLVPSAGACTDCAKNTACYKLLFQDEGKGRCMDRECFENKEEVQKTSLLKDIVDNHPEYIFLPGRYYTNQDRLKAVKSLGVDIAKVDEWEVVEKPDEVDASKYDLEDEDDKYDFDEAMEEYEEELKKYEAAVASGLMKKAYHIHDEKVVDVIPMSVLTGGPEPGSLDDTDPEKAKEIRLEAELADLVQKRERNDGMINEKMFTWASKEFENYQEDYVNRDAGLNHLEDAALMVILFNAADFDLMSELSERGDFNKYKNAEIYRWLNNQATIEDHRKIMRSAIINKFGSGDPKSNQGSVAAFLPIAEDVLGKPYSDMMDKLQADYAKRNAALDKQIEDIRNQLK